MKTKASISYEVPSLAQDAADIFQDGLVILNHNLRNGTFREQSSFGTYISDICKNLWLREYD